MGTEITFELNFLVKFFRKIAQLKTLEIGQIPQLFPRIYNKTEEKRKEIIITISSAKIKFGKHHLWALFSTLFIFSIRISIDDDAKYFFYTKKIVDHPCLCAGLSIKRNHQYV